MKSLLPKLLPCPFPEGTPPAPDGLSGFSSIDGRTEQSSSSLSLEQFQELGVLSSTSASIPAQCTQPQLRAQKILLLLPLHPLVSAPQALEIKLL